MSEFQQILTFLTTATTAIVAVATLVIGWRQYQTARAKLRFDLFERRYQVYLSLSEFIDEVQGRVLTDDEYKTHVRKLDQMPFLFDKPLVEWVSQLLRKARSMNNARRVTNRAMHNNPENIPHADIQDSSSTYNQLTIEIDKYQGEMIEKFQPYLSFSNNL